MVLLIDLGKLARYLTLREPTNAKEVSLPVKCPES